MRVRGDEGPGYEGMRVRGYEGMRVRGDEGPGYEGIRASVTFHFTEVISEAQLALEQRGRGMAASAKTERQKSAKMCTNTTPKTRGVTS